MFPSFADSKAPEAEIKTRRVDNSLVMQVNPPKGTHLNFEGPWKLEISGAVPLKNMKGTYGLESFDQNTRSFTLELTRAMKAEEKGEFKLIYFVCAENNSWCKRTETKGTI